MMGTISSCSTTSIFLLSTLLLGLCLQSNVATDDHNNVVLLDKKRETLEIIIGGDGSTNNNAPSSSPENGQYCPPPPPPPPPTRLELVQSVIKNFPLRVKKDPFEVFKTWKGNDICKYKGIVCKTVPYYNQTGVAGINFNGLKLGGPDLTLNGFIEELPDLVLFHANSNDFKGTIPAKISKLKYFYELDLSNNKFCGEFPVSVFGATKLTFLDLRFNSFYGKVPPQLYNLDILYLIFINNNNLAQPLPDNIGSTPALYLTFANNNFTGPIPPSIGKASETLTEILLSNNQLSGCLPFEIGHLKKAILFDASRNILTGPIPCSFACLEKMQLLNFTNNLLYGSIPELVCKLPELANFSLANNYISQVGPECRKLICNGVLDVKNNCILGLPNQRSKVECAEFFSKPRYCHNEKKSLTYVPCKKKLLSMSSRSLKPELERTAASPRLYAALTPDKL